MGNFSRRSFMAGMGAIGASSMLPNHSLAATNGRPARNLVMLHAFGGWDPALVLDPKPGVSDVVISPGEHTTYDGMRVHVPTGSPGVDLFFSQFAGETALLRGVDMVSLSHEICRRLLLTGTADTWRPDLGAVVAAELGSDLAIPYLMMSGRTIPGTLSSISGLLGESNQLGAVLHPDLGYAPLPAPLEQPPSAAKQRIDEWLLARSERMAPEFVSEQAMRQREAYSGGVERLAVLEGQREVFDQVEPLVSLDPKIDMTLKALANGLSRTIVVDSGMNWDTHYTNSLQVTQTNKLFRALAQLVQGLKTTPSPTSSGSLYDETLVWVTSEMGRTPGLNEGGGKEHLPFTPSLLIGAGVKPGTYSGTTDRLVGLPVNFNTGEVDEARGELLRPDHIVTGILEACGVDTNAWLPESTPFMAPFV